MTVKFLEQEQYYLIEKFFDREGVPRLDPQFSKVVAAWDGDQVVGILVLQLVAHVEPFIIEPDYREQGLWREMGEMMAGYAGAVGLPGVYTQPTHPEARAMCEKLGFEEQPHKLWLKVLDDSFKGLMPEGE